MKKIIQVNVLLWILIFVPVALLSQAASVPEAAAYQKVEQQFEVQIVSSEQLFLFEKKGIQHLIDFMNLVEMLSEEEVDPKFRSKLKMAAEKYFSAPTDSLFVNSKQKSDHFSVEVFLEKLEKGNLKFQEIKLSNFESATPVFSDKKYQWKVSFLFSQKGNLEKNMIAFFILKKEKKKFGNVEKEVWDVLITKIKEG